jgi:outer membrane protein assembly factor BamB
MTRLVLPVLLVLTLVSDLRADDWPQWRGPRRDGISLEKGLLKEWPKEGPTLAWSFKNAGLGFSSFAIRDGKLYTLGSRDDNEIILVLDATDGKELWTAKIGPIINAPENATWGDGPRSTPTLDGNLLFALGSQSDLVCVDLSKNGAEVWRTNLEKDYGGKLMSGWGYSESPLVDGDNLFVSPGGEKGNFVLLEKKTGKLVWQCTDVKQTAAYSSAMPADFGGVHQFVQLSYLPGKGYVNGIEAKTGKLLWQALIFKIDSFAAAPTPIITDKYVYVTTGAGGGCHLFEIKDGKAIDKYKGAVTKNVKNTHGGVVLLDGYIYGHSESVGWVCQDLLKGTLKWNEKEDLKGVSGAITAAEGMLYVYTDSGECGLVKADPEQSFSIVSTFKIPQRSAFPKTRRSSLGAKVWSHPVISGGHLFLRDAELIYCYDIRAKK